MLTPATLLREKLTTDKPVVGIMATDLLSPVLVEIAQRSGLEYLIVDREHGCFSDEAVAHVCQTGRLADFPVLVRTVSTETSIIRRIVDLGPCGILLPNVETTAELDEARDALFMPPRGRRRPGGAGNFWMIDFHYETWRDDFEDSFIVIPQIESQAGIANVDAIASHPLVTALGVGPYDLSADLGCCWNPENPEFQASLKTIRSAADKAGKKVWIGADAEAKFREGYTFLWVGTFTSVLSGTLSTMIRNLENSGQPKSNDLPPA
ncbi:MAG: aldolase/citrate lyase family protein [Verrucomicrobiales bacterium]|nr:aldolase/citrate lyase family protein [Verrucomicrobiales bacterium]